MKDGLTLTGIDGNLFLVRSDGLRSFGDDERHVFGEIAGETAQRGVGDLGQVGRLIGEENLVSVDIDVDDGFRMREILHGQFDRRIAQIVDGATHPRRIAFAQKGRSVDELRGTEEGEESEILKEDAYC